MSKINFNLILSNVNMTFELMTYINEQ